MEIGGATRAQSISNPGLSFSYRDARWFQGHIKVIACSDLRSLVLYKAVISKIGEVWPAAKIAAVPIDHIQNNPRSRARISAELSAPEAILKTLRVSNTDLHTYVIGHYNPSVRIIDLTGTNSLKSTPRIRFFEKLFMAILFTLRVFARNLLRGNRRRNLFCILFWCPNWGSYPRFTSNKPTHYLLDHGDNNWVKSYLRLYILNRSFLKYPKSTTNNSVIRRIYVFEIRFGTLNKNL